MGIRFKQKRGGGFGKQLIIASCPTRISLGSADHSTFSEQFGGVALNFAIDKRIYVIIRRRNQLEKYKYRISYSKTELCNNIDEIKLSPVRETLKYLNIKFPIEIIYSADVPTRLGLATSSAFILALLKALYALQNKRVPTEILVDQAYHIERQLIGQVGGFQDYYIAHGGVNYLTGRPHQVERRTVVLQPDIIQSLEDHLFMVYTGDQADSDAMLHDQLTKLKKGETLEQTLRIKCLVEEMHAILLSKSFKPLDLAYPMTEQWELKKQLSNNMVSEHVQRIEDIIRSNCDTAGIRLIGSGGRGFILALVPAEIKSNLGFRLSPYKCSSFKIDWDGVLLHTGV
jgi:D-glycero-alpha-D-manno-heptose-7-phosphate kinase